MLATSSARWASITTPTLRTSVPRRLDLPGRHSSSAGSYVRARITGGFSWTGEDFPINRKTVQEIEKAYPRTTFGTDGKVVLVEEFDKKPDCLLSHFPGGVSSFLFQHYTRLKSWIPKRDAFLKIIRVEPLVPEDE